MALAGPIPVEFGAVFPDTRASGLAPGRAAIRPSARCRVAVAERRGASAGGGAARWS